MAQSGGNLPAGYVALTIPATTAILNAKQLADLLESELSGYDYAEGFIDRDWTTSPVTNNQLISFMWGGSASAQSAWLRYRDDNYNSNKAWTTAYDIIVSAGSNIIVIAHKSST